MYYWEQCRPVAVLVDCVGLTSVQTFCLVVFCLSCSLSPCFPQAVRLSHFLQGQWHRMQSKPCISLRPWRYCIICPFFVFFVQMVGNGKRFSPVWIVHMTITDVNFSPSLSPFLPIPPPPPLSLPPPFSLFLWIVPLMTGNAPSKNLPRALHSLLSLLLQWPGSCRGKVHDAVDTQDHLYLKDQVRSPARGCCGFNIEQPPPHLQIAAGPVLNHRVPSVVFSS